MADHEVSKVMWIAIVVALAASIFVIAKPQVKTLAGDTFAKVEQVVEGINTGDSNNKPDPNVKYTVVGADATPINQDSLADITYNGKVVGHFSTDGTKCRVTFDTEDAKTLDLMSGEMGRLQYAGPAASSIINVNVSDVLGVDKDGQKTKSPIVFGVGPGNIELKGESNVVTAYGVVLDWDSTTNQGSAKVTSHYEEVADK